MLLQEDEEDLPYWIDFCTGDGCFHLKARFLSKMNKVQLAELDIHLATYVAIMGLTMFIMKIFLRTLIYFLARK